MSDVYGRLVAAVTHQRQLAEQALTVDIGAVLTISWPRTASKDALLRFLDANDPASVIRHCDADLELIREHRETDEGNCRACYDPNDFYVRHPCAVIRNRCAAYDIPTEEPT